jgi:hypothetical protein
MTGGDKANRCRYPMREQVEVYFSGVLGMVSAFLGMTFFFFGGTGS